ncbi:S-4TM family putative pore-forming effector [Robinsoniella peoriensis]|uniref:S-4TM family putative pore-forming effector n=1 Tax=Robinsoniella peoriensis TaxID=180332 RepID=UPI00375051DC
MNSVSIKQNEEEMLKYQFAARVYYNRAELINFLIWVFCVISASCVFISVDALWFQGIPLAADIIAAWLGIKLSRTLSNASLLRSYFDAYVLNIDIDSFEDSTVRRIKEISTKIILSKCEDYREQIINTGNDVPPGVRDWYDIPASYSEKNAQFECQKQNCWWNKKMTHKRFLLNILFAVFAALVVFFAVRNVSIGDSIIIGVFGSGAIIMRCIERFSANKQYHDLSQQIDGAVEALSESRDIKNIYRLQKLINKRRELPILEMNFIHKRIAKPLSEMYHNFLS